MRPNPCEVETESGKYKDKLETEGVNNNFYVSQCEMKGKTDKFSAVLIGGFPFYIFDPEELALEEKQISTKDWFLFEVDQNEQAEANNFVLTLLCTHLNSLKQNLSVFSWIMARYCNRVVNTT